MRRLLAGLLASTLMFAPLGAARAAIASAVDLGQVALTTGAALTMDVPVASTVAVGTLVFVPVVSTNNGAIVGCADSAGNTYTTIPTVYNNGGNIHGGCYKVLTTQLSAGGTITVTFGATLGRKLASAYAVTGIAAVSPLDVIGTGATATSTTPGIATGVTSAADEMLFVCTYINPGSVDTWTEDAAWQQSSVNAVVDTRIWRCASKIVSSTASVNYLATNSASRVWSTQNWSFKGDGAAPVLSGTSMLLMGVGK